VRLQPPFRADGEHIAADLPGAHVLFTTRRGGVSTGPYASLNLGLFTDDDPARVSANRDRVAGAVGVERGHFQQGRQVHAAHVRALAAAPDPHEEPAPADGQATSVAGVAPIVLVADCLPIALAAPGAVAVLHAGWRGLHGGVVAEGVRALRALGGGDVIEAAIGPGAGGCCYEVGEEVHAAFASYGPEVRNGRNLDLKAIARRELEAAGVTAVHDVGVCTLCADPGLFFSHRRDGGVTGRQAGVAWRS
jgi:YfiH family protein